ncbi:3D domain-containing protein [Lysinibacillus odysseyi]|uniref:3D domain-containing protein n=2 Tax=Lysinibacillus odysseyi TaxID=202611 RepID=UPI0009DCAF09|nr:3D domain-containing protein [Lysinibacillus odysseyi]
MMKRISYFIFAFIVCFTTMGAPAQAYFPSIENEKEPDIDLSYFTDALDATIPIAWQLDLEEESKMYTVEEGDNLYRIALAHDISLESLIGWNDLKDYLIYPGDELKVSGEEIDGAGLQDTFIASAPVLPASKSLGQANETAAPPSPTEKEAVKELTVTATAYTAYCEGCSGTTAYGIDLRANPNRKVIAVDPRIIPLGTKVWVEGYGEAIAGDTGGAIKGHKIDVFIPSHENAIAWGVKTVKLRVLN